MDKPINVHEAKTHLSRLLERVEILAAGECRLRTRGRELRLVDPRLYTDSTRRDMPFPVRQFLGLLRVSEFLRMRIEP
jgi:hypothetical protein